MAPLPARRSRSTPAGSSARSAGRCSCRSSRTSRTASTRPSASSPARSPPTWCRSRASSSSPGTIAERVGGGRVVRAGYVALRRCASLLAALAPDIGTFIGGTSAHGRRERLPDPDPARRAVGGRPRGGARPQRRHVRGSPDRRAHVRPGARRRARRGLLAARVRPRRRGGARARAAPARARGSVQSRPRATRLRSSSTAGSGCSRRQAMAGYLGFTAIGLPRRARLRRGVRPRLRPRPASSSPPTASAASCSAATAGSSPTGLDGRAPRLLGVARLRGRRARRSRSLRRPGASPLVFFAVGCASAFAWAALNTIVVESFPENRAGAVSAYSAFKFVGVAFAPLVYVPLFHVDRLAGVPRRGGLLGRLRAARLPWFGSTGADGPAGMRAVTGSES